MSSTIRPRPDQIDELTRGLSLPVEAIDGSILEVVAEQLAQAFSDISATAGATVSTGTEAEVTALMETRLNRLIDQDPLWGQLVLNVVRGKETLSFDGSHLEKRPDLSIHLSSRDRNFPLIVEAKLIEKTKTEVLYCDNGVRRFVDGEYSWATREAFMLAYVRDKSTIASTLTPFMARAMTLTPSGYQTTEGPVAITQSRLDLARSRHGRSFAYSHPTAVPGAISIWHLWLA